MRICSVATDRYEADIGQLMKRRLEREGFLGASEHERRCVTANIADEAELLSWCRAVTALLVRDLSQFEIAYMVNEFPIPLEEKKLILRSSISRAQRLCAGDAQRGIEEHFARHDHLVLEGFMAFRMKENLREWEGLVMRCADELTLDAEYVELMQVLAALARMRQPGPGEISVVLNPDGSCTFTDDERLRIDYDHCTGDGIMSVLVGLAPERILVYDLSGGRSAAIAQDLMRVFAGRVRFFR